MNQSLVTTKNIQILVEMFKIKNDMSSAIVSDIFLPGAEIITTLCNEMTFFYILYKLSFTFYVMAKLILSRCKNVEQHISRTKTRIFPENF